MSDTDDLTPATPTTRVGSGADLARRMDRVEARADSMETEVRALTATVARVDQNQQHATDLNRLRFDALETGMKNGFAQLGEFTKRFEGIISGDISTAQSRQGAELLKDYQNWRADVDSELARLSNFHEDDDAKAVERARIAYLANRGLAAVILVANFILGLVVVIINVVTQ